ncbi:unnamed protein product [Echinostoma caproni]|uniref:CCR4-NOT transcription complex subunit 11 n=1 Tax=Echinostoma caproni TaxID=27848 RepID=A0A183B2Q0_9TREM|nr:unnamed protein product [Echinostoma caproni]
MISSCGLLSLARNVRSQRFKYLYVLEAIPGDRISTIEDIILKPPEVNAYDVLKAVILQFYSPSNEERLRQLLTRHPIGDTTPSMHLVRLCMSVCPANAQSDIVKEMRLESLPLHIQPTVTALLENASIVKAAAICQQNGYTCR